MAHVRERIALRELAFSTDVANRPVIVAVEILELEIGSAIDPGDPADVGDVKVSRDHRGRRRVFLLRGNVVIRGKPWTLQEEAAA